MTTRFRPTPTCDLHLGHLWVAWHNWVDAARGGDQFLVIMDDICYNLQNVWQAKWPPHVFAERFAEDFAWAGIPCAAVHYSTTQAEAHAQAAEALGYSRCAMTGYTSFDTRTILSRETHAPPVDAYHEWLTLTRVVDDHECGVQAFTRGADLIGERQLYDHMWRRLYPAGLPPRQTYVPCVRRANSEKKESTGAQAASVRQLRDAGYSAEELLGTLQECARLSTEAGLADVVIPDGVLSLNEHRPLTPQTWAENLRLNARHQALEPWGEDVIVTVERVIGRVQRGGTRGPTDER